MASPLSQPAGGRTYDPVFISMLIAVVLAVGSSITLRAVVTGFGPASAHAAGVDQSSNRPSANGIGAPAPN